VLEQLGASAESVVAVRDEAEAVSFEITAPDSQKPFAASDLALAAERIEGLGGRIVVTSGDGRGVRVTASLPLPASP
jgi:hypothetical protein